MADYGIQATGLLSPPSQAFVTAYRPAIASLNTGVHPFIATGTISIYDATTGLLVISLNLLSSTIQPGATGPATSSIYWTPPAPGPYLAFGSVQFVASGHVYTSVLAPTPFSVSAEPPPPPPVVDAHASQHEDGGFDELDVNGLPGILSQPQTPRDHVDSHEAGGDDELSIDGLPGRAAEDQPPEVHNYTRHDLTVETTTAKGIANGYCPLGPSAKVPHAYLPPSALGQRVLKIIPVQNGKIITDVDPYQYETTIYPDGTYTHLFISVLAQLASNASVQVFGQVNPGASAGFWSLPIANLTQLVGLYALFELESLDPVPITVDLALTAGNSCTVVLTTGFIAGFSL